MTINHLEIRLQKLAIFQKSVLDDFEIIEKNDHDLSLVRADFDCAWSVTSCMIDSKGGYVDEKPHISLKTATKELGIQRVTCKSIETGIGFEEFVTFDIDNNFGIQEDSRDLYPEPYDEWLEPDEINDPKYTAKRMKELFGKEDECQKS